MLFNSYAFLFVFLPCTLSVYYLSSNCYRNLVLTIVSYLFYSYWDYRFCSLVLISTVWDYYIGKQIFHTQNKRKRVLLLGLSLLLNLGMLGYFKYFNFFIQSFTIIFPDISISNMEIILPIGISFYTFQSLSYSIDIFRNKVKPVDHFIDFACFISMFPQLIAGPIVRYNQIAAQISSRQHTVDKFADGIRRFVIGLAKKVLIADMMAVIADAHFNVASPGLVTAWTGATAFSLQIYFDFSGYSDMAIGLGNMLGFNLPENFNFPYNAKGVSDFWRRWHMSLSGWLRDYLYIPLGGSRKSAPRVNFNLMITMLICGLWHGASWTFVIWGGYHGLFLIIERPFRRMIQDRIPSWLTILYTYIVVVVGWVIFRAESISQIQIWFKAMFGFSQNNTLTFLPSNHSLIAFMIVIQLSCWIMNYIKDIKTNSTAFKDAGVILIMMTCIVVILGSDSSPFLYYQF